MPGSVAGFELAREKYGSKSREELIAPAIALARDGFALTDYDAASLNKAIGMFGLDPRRTRSSCKPDGVPSWPATRWCSPTSPRR